MCSEVVARPIGGSRSRSVDHRPSLRLTTVEGAEDLLAEEVRALGPSRRHRGSVDLDPGPAEGWSKLLAALSDRRLYRTAAMIIPGLPGQPRFDRTLRAVIDAISDGADSAGGFRVAAPRERAVQDHLSDVTGWECRPGDWSVNLVPDRDHWLVELGPLHWTGRHHRLERLPWSTPPVLAEVLVRLAKPKPAGRVLDPCCGAGTILIAAGLAGAGALTGYDRDADAVATATANLDRFGLVADLRLGDAGSVPVPTGSIDRVVSNLPFGKRVGSHDENRSLYPRLLAEIARALTPDGRAVLLTEDKRLFVEAVQRTPGHKIIRERVLRYSGATPTAYVIGRTKGQRISRSRLGTSGG